MVARWMGWKENGTSSFILCVCTAIATHNSNNKRIRQCVRVFFLFVQIAYGIFRWWHNLFSFSLSLSLFLFFRKFFPQLYFTFLFSSSNSWVSLSRALLPSSLSPASLFHALCTQCRERITTHTHTHSRAKKSRQQQTKPNQINIVSSIVYFVLFVYTERQTHTHTVRWTTLSGIYNKYYYSHIYPLDCRIGKGRNTTTEHTTDV